MLKRSFFKTSKATVKHAIFQYGSEQCLSPDSTEEIVDTEDKTKTGEDKGDIGLETSIPLYLPTIRSVETPSSDYVVHSLMHRHAYRGIV